MHIFFLCIVLKNWTLVLGCSLHLLPAEETFVWEALISLGSVTVLPPTFAFGSFFPLFVFSTNLGIFDAQEQIFFYLMFINCCCCACAAAQNFLALTQLQNPIFHHAFCKSWAQIRNLWNLAMLCKLVSLRGPLLCIAFACEFNYVSHPLLRFGFIYCHSVSYNLLWWLQSIQKQHSYAKASSCVPFFLFRWFVSPAYYEQVFASFTFSYFI